MKPLVLRKSDGSEEIPVSPRAMQSLAELKGEAASFLAGKDQVVDTLLSAVLCSGHVLFEDVPGVGKTTVVRAIAKWLGLEMARIQCTSDLLPSDILGVEVFSREEAGFVFHRGPIFSPVVLVDELNRASPRTQSALLEAMAEGSVSINRKSYALPEPFLVFATQNPSEYVGTYPLPESQLDRFAARIHLDYPVQQKEREIFALAEIDPLAGIRGKIIDEKTLSELQGAVSRIFVSERVVNLVQRVAVASRTHAALRLGISTRGGIIWMRMARARALLQGRGYVTPDDCLALAVPCLSHRMVARAGGATGPILDGILSSLEID